MAKLYKKLSKDTPQGTLFRQVVIHNMASSTTPHHLVTDNETILRKGVIEDDTGNSPQPMPFPTYEEAEVAADKFYAADLAKGFAP